MSEVRQKLEELQKEELNNEQEHEKEPVKQEYSEVEQEALSEGWNPEGKDKDGNTLSADEYLARKPLFNKIKNLNTSLEEVKNTLKEVQGDSRKMAQAFMKEKEDLLSQLEAKREKALDDLDVDQVKELDKQIKEVGKAESPAQYTKLDWKKAFIPFLKENPWYDTNPGLKSAADIIGETYMEENPAAPPADIYSHVASEIKKEFGDRLESSSPSQSKVTSTNRRSTAQQKKTSTRFNDLDPEEQRVVSVMANAVGKSIEEYMKNYKTED